MKKIIYVSLGFFSLLSASLAEKKANSFETEVEQATKITEEGAAKASKVSTKKEQKKKNRKGKKRKKRKNTLIVSTTLLVIGVSAYLLIWRKRSHYVLPPDIDKMLNKLNNQKLTIDANKSKGDLNDDSLAKYSMYDGINDEERLELTNKYLYHKGEEANRAIGVMYGMAIGDATGAPLEFLDCVDQYEKAYFDLKNKKWIGEKNKFRLKRGQWTDDAAMGLCMADSLIQGGGFDGSDIRIRFWNWWFHGYNNAFRLDKKRGHKTSVGLGNNISKSIYSLQQGIKPPPAHKDEASKKDSGNGSLMRLAPIPIFFCNTDIETALEYAKKSSFTTHQGLIAAECCALMTYIIIQAIKRNKSEKNIKDFLDRVTGEYLKRIEKEYKKVSSKGGNQDEVEAKGYVIRLLKSNEEDDSTECNWNWKNKKGELGVDKVMENRGKNYNGYPNNATYFGSYSMDGLAMGLHAVYNSTSFGTAIENAVNLLGDADSTGSIAGQLAGAFYGFRDVMEDTHNEQYLFDYTEEWEKRSIWLRAILLLDRGKELG